MVNLLSLTADSIPQPRSCIIIFIASGRAIDPRLDVPGGFGFHPSHLLAGIGPVI